MDDKKEWNWCVVGNITKTHLDPDGTLRYGSSAFTGGTKVYLVGRTWDPNHDDKIWVMGLSRSKKHIDSHIAPALIENVRLSRVYKPSIVQIMNDQQMWGAWWHNSPEDRAEAAYFVKRWNEVFFPTEAK